MVHSMETASSRNERRQKPRVQVEIAANYRVLNRQKLRPAAAAGEQPLRAHIQNLGIGGALLLVDRAIAQQAVVSLAVQLPRHSFPVRSLAEVKHVQKSAHHYAVGVEFLSISRLDTRAVQKFVRGRMN